MELLEQAMSDIGNEIVTKQDGLQDRSEIFSTAATTTTTSAPITVYPTTDEPTTEKSGRRRGVWKRVRVRPIDAFETAESQNIGNQIYNTILSNSSKEHGSKGFKNSAFQHSYKLVNQDEDVAEELTTIQPDEDEVEVTTIHSPGDIDLGTGAPILNVTEMTTESEQTTMEPTVDVTTIFSDFPELNVVTRRHDVGTEQPIEDKTEAPHNEYDDYDVDAKLVRQKDSNVNSDDVSPAPLPSQSSRIIDEVKQKLTELFSFTDDYDYHENSLKPKVHEYTTIDRTRSNNKLNEDLEQTDEDDDELTEEDEMSEHGIEEIAVETSTIQSSTEPNIEKATSTTMSSFHRNLMDSVIYATSTSTEISHETEICYRGRCIKTDRQK